MGQSAVPAGTAAGFAAAGVLEPAVAVAVVAASVATKALITERGRSVAAE